MWDVKIYSVGDLSSDDYYKSLSEYNTLEDRMELIQTCIDRLKYELEILSSFYSDVQENVIMVLEKGLNK